MSCILIYSKNTLYREYLAKVVSNDCCADSIISIDDVSRLHNVLAVNKPDYIIIDLYSRNFNDNILSEVVKYFEGKKIIIITTSENRHINYYYYNYGIVHFIYAEDESSHIMTSISGILSGDGNGGRAKNGSNVLTSRECEILRLIAAGNTSKEIADILCISKNTVDTHRNKMLQKLDLTNSASLVHYAYKSGLF